MNIYVQCVPLYTPKMSGHFLHMFLQHQFEAPPESELLLLNGWGVAKCKIS